VTEVTFYLDVFWDGFCYGVHVSKFKSLGHDRYSAVQGEVHE
jgi:hypothetical protein